MGAFLTYLKGLRPRNRKGLAFGSFGWGGQSIGEIEQVMHDLKWETPKESIKVQYIPGEAELVDIKETGKNLGELVAGD
jgi:flavorubredoxin